MNIELQLASEYVRNTGANIFLTGKAGTGKTTFLHNLKKSGEKRMVVTAPTGVAAINAGGVTLHSFFQLPFGPFIPERAADYTRYRFSRDKISIIKSLDLLVIDEISMVRADVLDAVDSVLRRFRRRDVPFGGAQLLMIGDLFQLPPVVNGQEWELLKSYYASAYFFCSTALAKTETVTIELKQIYRQSDTRFIDLLNRVRGDRADGDALRELNQRHLPNFAPKEDEGYITLCTHNRIADQINSVRLARLQQKPKRFEAEIEGEFPEQMYPTASMLVLKPGAQVMFVRNDISPEKRFFNGKIGKITHILDKTIRIQCPQDSEPIEVEPATWENIEYTLNRQTLELSEHKIGTFKQYPLTLAWAITIHKSQGLTFDKAIIDAQAAFAHGQVYVALSRCRTLEGIVLSTPLSAKAIITDPAVRCFCDEADQNTPSADQLYAAKIRYQQQLLIDCFDFKRLRFLLQRLMSLLLSNPGAIHVSGVDDIRQLQRLTEREVVSVGDNFCKQLQRLFPEAALPGDNAVILERLSKASSYFSEKIANGIGSWLPELTIDTDNKELAKNTKNALELLQKEVEIKSAGIQCCGIGFSPSHYFKAIANADIGASHEKKEKPSNEKKEKPKTPDYSESDITHPELFQTLKGWRSQKATDEGVPHFQVMHQKTLIQITIHLPDTLPDLKKIKGIGKRLAERYGQELLSIVNEYRSRHDIQKVILPTPAEKEPSPERKTSSKVDTKLVTLELFEKGMNPSEIAKERNLAPSTIEGHMAHWIEVGKVDIHQLMPAEKLGNLESEMTRMADKPLGEIRQALGNAVSYGELKMVQAHLKRRSIS
jgi:hypothetical protein